MSSLRKTAFDFATGNGVKHNFNQYVKMAGMNWYYGADS